MPYAFCRSPIVCRSSTFCLTALLGLTSLAMAVAAQDAPPALDLTPETSATAEAATETSDAATARRLEAIYAAIPQLEEIVVEVRGGVVILAGTALSVAGQQDAVNLARQVDGVLYVLDRIELETNAGRVLTPALERLQSYAKGAFALLPLLGVALAVLALFAGLATLLSRWEAPYRRLGLDPLLASLIRQLVTVTVLITGTLLALDLVGATSAVAAILGTAGLVGLAVGFAFRDIVENYLAGILMGLRQPFARGDVVEVAGMQGKVIRLTSRDLVLMSLDGNHLRIPNATVFKSEMTNFTRNPRRRFGFQVGVDVEEDLQLVQRLGVAALSAMKGVLDDPPPFSAIDGLGDSNVLLTFYGWVDQQQADFLKVRSQAIRLVKRALDEAGVLMPEPITNVRVQQVPAGVRLGEPAGSDAAVSTLALPEGAVADDVRADAGAIDVSPDRHLDRQIEEDVARSGEEDLLEAEPTR